MIFKRYCVTVNDNWTSLRTFWTLEGAKGFYRQHLDCANVFGWDNGKWDWFCGARDLIPAAPVETKPDTVGKSLREYLKFKYSAPSDACKCGNCQLIPASELARFASEGDTLRDRVEALERQLADTQAKCIGCLTAGERDETIAAMSGRVEALGRALSASSGYLLNAKIDLETGATKRTAIQTIEGGLKMVRAVLIIDEMAAETIVNKVLARIDAVLGAAEQRGGE